LLPRRFCSAEWWKIAEAVLRPDIIALAVERGRVWNTEEHLEDFLE